MQLECMYIYILKYIQYTLHSFLKELLFLNKSIVRLEAKGGGES